MSKARPYNRDSLERALVHHGVKFFREEGRWIINDTGPFTDAQAYAYTLGFKAARDQWEPLVDATRSDLAKAVLRAENRVEVAREFTR
jgi:hypothetical protein